MYAPNRTAVRTVGSPYHITRRKRVPDRNTQDKKDNGPQRGRYDFLSEKINTIGPTTVTRSREVENYNYITQENYEYLLKCAQRYAELTGFNLNHKPGPNLGANIAQLYNDLDSILDDNVGINFQTNGERLDFVIWTQLSWGEYSLYWIPVSFLHDLPTPLRRLVISFLHQFKESTRIDTTNHNDELSFIKEWKMECLHQQKDSEGKAMLELIDSYEQGRIYKLLDRITKRNYHKDLAKALREYVPANKYEEQLVELMTEGLKFIGPSVPTVFNYEYNPYEDEENDEWPVRFDLMFLFIYEFDEIMEGLISYLNDMAGNYGENLLASTLVLSPDMTQVLGKDTFPTEFMEYLDKFISFIRN
ncbi:hypothetical protein LJB87_01240 [Alistipes sp. OttesenSCG-928-L06]|nr:hypothetical protein [Alistipes sp. OttesenSCG-928-L06]